MSFAFLLLCPIPVHSRVHCVTCAHTNYTSLYVRGSWHRLRRPSFSLREFDRYFFRSEIVTSAINLTGCLFAKFLLIAKGKSIFYDFPRFLTNNVLYVRYQPSLVWECSGITKGLMKSIMYRNPEFGVRLSLAFSGCCEPR